MTDKEKRDMQENMRTMAESYFEVFAMFLTKTGSSKQAFRLTKDMFSAILQQNKKPDSLSIFWDQGGGMKS